MRCTHDAECNEDIANLENPFHRYFYRRLSFPIADTDNKLIWISKDHSYKL